MPTSTLPSGPTGEITFLQPGLYRINFWAWSRSVYTQYGGGMIYNQLRKNGTTFHIGQDYSAAHSHENRINVVFEFAESECTDHLRCR